MLLTLHSPAMVVVADQALAARSTCKVTNVSEGIQRPAGGPHPPGALQPLL